MMTYQSKTKEELIKELQELQYENNYLKALYDKDITESKRAEEALSESEEKYRVLFEGSTLGILAADIETHRVLYFNPTICRIFGYLDEEFLQLTIPDLHPKDSMDLVISDFESLMRENKVMSSTLPCLRKDGTVFYADIAGNPTIINGRKCSVVFFVDVTMRKQAEDAVRQSRKELDSLFKASPEMISFIGFDGYFKRLNPAWVKTLGYPMDKLLSLPFIEFVHPDDREATNAEAAKLAEGQRTILFENRYRCNDGSYRWLTWSIIPDTKEKLLYAVARDITERKRTEDAMRESELKFRNYIDYAPHGVFVADEMGNYVDVNTAASSITGYSKDELLSMKLFELIPEESMEISARHFEKVVRDGFAIEEFSFIKKDRSIGYWSVEAVKLSDQRFLGFVVDITKRKEAEEELRESKVKYQGIFESTGIATFIGDENGIILMANKECYSITGYNPTEIIGQKWNQYFAPESLQEIMKNHHLRRQNPDLAPKKHEVKLFYKQGEKRDVILNISMISGTKQSIVSISDITERKRAEEMLRESKVKYQAIFENTGTATFIIDEGNTILMANNECYSITGYIPTEIIGQKWNQYFAPESLQEMLKNHQLIRQISDLAQKKYEVKLVNKQGEIRDVILNIGMIPGTKQSIVSISDITERKRAEEALRKSEENLGKMVANIGDVIVIIDQNGINRYKSPNIEKWFGWRPEEVIGFSTWENIHPDELNSVQKIFGALLGKPNATVTTECRYQCKDGSYKWIEFTGINLLHDPYIQGILGNYHDITERKQAEETLRESEERFRKIFEESQVGIIISTLSYRFEKVNPAFCSMMGYTTNELISMTFADITHPDDIGNDIENIKKLELGEIPSYLAEKRYLRKTGEIRWGNITISLIGNKDGTQLYYLGMIHDITERKRAEQALGQSEKNFRRSISESPLGIRIVSVDGKTIYANKAFFDIYEFNSLEEFRSIPAINRHTPESYTQHQERKEKRKNGNDVFDYEISIIRENTEIRYVKVWRKEVLWNGIKHYQVINIDITERKRAVEALNNSQQELRKFASHLQNVREEEKIALAREIHDDLGQILVALKIDLGMFKKKISKGIEAATSQELLSKFNDLSSQVDNTIKSARRIMNGLRPELIELLGFEEACKSYLLDFEGTHHINSRFESAIMNPNISLEQSVALFRILQEALNNIIKHAKATLVTVQLSNPASKLVLQVVDNGVGFNGNHKGRQDSYGLIGMKERVFLLGGNLDITSKVGKGTSVRVEIPYINKS